jgi:cytochrome c5
LVGRGARAGAGLSGCRADAAPGLAQSVLLAAERGFREDPMSNAQSAEHEENHEGPIRTPKQLVAAVVASFAVPIVVIIMLANFVNFGGKSGAGSDGMSEESVARRLQPVGSVVIKDASAPAVLHTGEQVYQAQCSACHATGVAGSPKFGDAAAWAPRIKTGYEALLNSALKGKNAMTAQGGGAFSDYEIGRAVVYMANQGGAKFDEPQAPATVASAPAAAASK